MFNKKLFVALGLAPLLFASTSQAAVITHYDIDFSAPTHTVGSAPTTGSGTDTPSSTTFGSTNVESSFNALSGESLVFNTSGNTEPCCFYDQIKLDLSAGYDNYQLSFDMAADAFVNTGSNNAFRVLFDTPQVRSLDFKNNGSIGVYHPFGPSSANTGSFTNDMLYNVMVDINLVTNLWDIKVNSLSIFSGAFTSTGGDINSIRFSFGAMTSGASTVHDSVGIDNIKLTSQVPVPATLALLVLGLLGLATSKRRKV